MRGKRMYVKRQCIFESLETRLLFAGDDLRTKIPGEGYLEYFGSRDQAPFYGHERSGWTDIMDPGTKDSWGVVGSDSILGYDWSSLRAKTRSVSVDIRTGDGTFAAGEADLNAIRKDFDIANQVFAQIGLTILNTYASRIDFPGTTRPAVGLPLVTDTAADLDNLYRILQHGRDGDSATIDIFYTPGIDELKGDGQTMGLTQGPNDHDGRGPHHGILLTAARFLDTPAHELGHFFLQSSAEGAVADYRTEHDEPRWKVQVCRL